LCFGGEVRSLLLSGTVGNALMFCGEGNCLAPKNSKAWGLSFTCVYGGRLLALSSKLRVSEGQQRWQLESSGVRKAAVALGSCVGAWASTCHSSCCRHGEPKSAGSGSPEVFLLAPGYPEQQQLWRHRGTKSLDSRNSGACFPGVGSRRAV
jgi:hypothetical protein